MTQISVERLRELAQQYNSEPWTFPSKSQREWLTGFVGHVEHVLTNETPKVKPITRIDQLTEGMEVVLRFDGHREESAKFLRMVGKGDSRRATFQSWDKPFGKDLIPYEWEAYRYNRRWSYGSGAGRLKLVSVSQ